MRTALLIVDVQKDFLPGGALAVPHGDEVIPRIKKLAPQYDLVVTTGDWHPRQTPHWEKWPVHCVANTEGAKLHPEISGMGDYHIFKGTGEADGYSAFEGFSPSDPALQDEIRGDSLTTILKQRGINLVTVVGLALDYCVKWTAKDARSNGFLTTVELDATRPVETLTGWKKTIDDLERSGVRVV